MFFTGKQKKRSLLIISLSFWAASLFAEAVDLYRFEVPEAISTPKEGHLKIGPSNPDGPVWGCTSRYMTLDGKPVMPVMGEFHFSRYPAEEWDGALAKIKAGGVDIVATYLFWIHHEEEEGVFDFSGQRDIRRFIELCQKHDLFVWVRLGPWCHGEVRNGGMPDWLRKTFGIEDENGHIGWREKSVMRSNDPEYLALAERLYTAYGEQCKGFMARDGGPIIGVQVENEYSKGGRGRGEAHIAKLIEIAKKHGFDAPFFSVTGWHNAPFPANECLPMFGGYPAAPWAGGTKKLKPKQVYRFDLQRDPGGIGTDVYTAAIDSRRDLSPYPLMTCEIGVGNQVTDHRRPWVNTLDGVVPAFTRLGIGAGCMGYYVYHGGTNPDGKFTTLQESKATGYPNDCPVKSYDFGAAIRESGRLDEKYHYLRKMHYLMQNYGERLAPTVAVLPDRAPEKNQDFSMVRMSLRTDGQSGFLFVNNHVRGYEQPDRENVQVAVKLGGREIMVPSRPVTIPSSAYFVWPVFQTLEGAQLLYATAQPLCVLENKDVKTYVFAQTVTDNPEYVFAPETIKGKSSRFAVEPGLDSLLEIKDSTGRAVRVLTLTAAQSLKAYKIERDGEDHLEIREPPRFVKVPDPKISKVGKNEWNIKTSELPKGALLRVRYTGNVAELYLDDRLIYDNFYNGEVFEVSLERFAKELKNRNLTLKISPLAESKRVYLDVPRPPVEPVLEAVEIVVEQ